MNRSTVFYDPPIFINVRDRVEDLKRLVTWLRRAGHKRITLLDNDSTYKPCVEYLEDMRFYDSVKVVRLRKNLGSRSIWVAGLVPQDEPWVFTDPDCIPTEDCPFDALWYMRWLLDKYPQYPKVGLGLKLDDVPETLSSLSWERDLVTPGVYLDGRLEIKDLEQGVFGSLVDTTFALYRPGMDYQLAGIRLAAPYQVRHMSWYRHNSPTEEDRYYLDRAIKGPLGSSWAQGL